MPIKLKGKYKFTLKFNVPSWGTVRLNSNNKNNNFTNEGNNFLLRRLYNSTLDPIKYILISKTGEIEKLKEGLSRETIKIEPKDREVLFHAEFTSDEMVGIEQIGLTNRQHDGIIITHSTFSEPYSQLPPEAKIELTYTLTLKDN